MQQLDLDDKRRGALDGMGLLVGRGDHRAPAGEGRADGLGRDAPRLRERAVPPGPAPPRPDALQFLLPARPAGERRRYRRNGGPWEKETETTTTTSQLGQRQPRPAKGRKSTAAAAASGVAARRETAGSGIGSKGVFARYREAQRSRRSWWWTARWAWTTSWRRCSVSLTTYMPLRRLPCKVSQSVSQPVSNKGRKQMNEQINGQGARQYVN